MPALSIQLNMCVASVSISPTVFMQLNQLRLHALLPNLRESFPGSSASASAWGSLSLKCLYRPQPPRDFRLYSIGQRAWCIRPLGIRSGITWSWRRPLGIRQRWHSPICSLCAKKLTKRSSFQAQHSCVSAGGNCDACSGPGRAPNGKKASKGKRSCKVLHGFRVIWSHSGQCILRGQELQALRAIHNSLAQLPDTDL